MKRSPPFFEPLTRLDNIQPPEHDPYKYDPGPHRIAPQKREKKYIRIVLNSDADTGALGVWPYITYDLFKSVPSTKIQELLAANTYTFYLESIVWAGSTVDSIPFAICIDNVISDNTYGCELKNVLQLIDNVALTNYQADPSKGLHTNDKTWLQNGRIVVAFKSRKGVQLTDAALDSASPSTTKYTAVISIHYE